MPDCITRMLTVAALVALSSCAPTDCDDHLFAPAVDSPLLAGANVSRPAVGDLNGDTFPDIVVACAAVDDADRAQLVVFLGDGTGRFKTVRFPITGDAHGMKLALGDINNDAILDAIVVRHDSYDVSFMLGDGRGRFNAAPELTVPGYSGTQPHTHDVATADVNNDNLLDVLTTCADDNAVAVLLGDGSGRFTPASGSPFPAGRHPYDHLTVTDLNEDGAADIVIANLLGATVSVLMGDGMGRFTPALGSPFAVAHRPGVAAVGLLNDDATVDVVVTFDDDPIVTVLLGDGHGGLKREPNSPLALDQPAWDAAIGDLNDDGHNDIALGGREDRVLILFGDGCGGFSPPIRISTGGNMPGYLTLADMNGDDRLDLIVGHFGSGRIAVLLATP